MNTKYNESVWRRLASSPTSQKIATIYPEGSVPTREQVVRWYTLISKTKCKAKRLRKKKDGVNHYVESTVAREKRNRGKELYRDLIKLGFWESGS